MKQKKKVFHTVSFWQIQFYQHSRSFSVCVRMCIFVCELAQFVFVIVILLAIGNEHRRKEERVNEWASW